MDARIRGLGAALDLKWVGTSKNVLSIAEGGLINVSNILVGMKEKLIQAANDTLGQSERNAIRSEILQFTEEINDIVEETQFNKNVLLDGTYINKSFQTGEGSTDTLFFSITANSSATGLGIQSVNVANNVFSAASATLAQDAVDTAIDLISATLQDIGAIIARLTVKEAPLRIGITNTEAAKAPYSGCRHCQGAGRIGTAPDITADGNGAIGSIEYRAAERSGAIPVNFHLSSFNTMKRDGQNCRPFLLLFTRIFCDHTICTAVQNTHALHFHTETSQLEIFFIKTL